MKRILHMLRRADRWAEILTDWACTMLLLTLTLVILYSVVMRYVFSQPPFWSDIVSMFGNVGMIMLGLSLTVRNRELIAMRAVYEKISPLLGLLLDTFWNSLILIFAVIFTWYGLLAALAVPGFYWELGMLPQKYPMLIVPVAGALLIVACTGILVQDIDRLITHRTGDKDAPPPGDASTGRDTNLPGPRP